LNKLVSDFGGGLLVLAGKRFMPGAYRRTALDRLLPVEFEQPTLTSIQDVIGTLVPLPGAREFLDALREQTQVIILSDTFEEFAKPLMRQLGWPTIFCHRLVVEEDHVTGYTLRQPDQKRRSVESLRGLNYRVLAAGDSFNDISMLEAAHEGYFFHAPEAIQRQFPQFKAHETYDGLLGEIQRGLKGAV
jgi:phosphoserine/homoserine phosphotransferase